MNAYASPDLAGDSSFSVGSGDPTGTVKQLHLTVKSFVVVFMPPNSGGVRTPQLRMFKTTSCPEASSFAVRSGDLKVCQTFGRFKEDGNENRDMFFSYVWTGTALSAVEKTSLK